jgi:predicted transcriptional regulator
MPKCLICGDEILAGSRFVTRFTDGGPAEAHNECIVKLRALMDLPSTHVQPVPRSPASAIVERVENDWMLVKRDLPTTTIILAYLEKQDSSCEVKSLYEWLRKNEVDVKNPSDYVQKMKKSGLVAVMKKDEARLIKITDKGLEVLGSLQPKSNSRSESPLCPRDT